MPQTTKRASAEIIPFPSRKSDARVGKAGDARRAAKQQLPTGAAPSEFGSCWYHDAAVQDDARRPNPL